MATACQATFLTLHGAQIFSPYVGDSEAEIRRVFQRARASAPAILFLDEVGSTLPCAAASGFVTLWVGFWARVQVDALVGRRGEDGRSVAARVSCCCGCERRVGRLARVFCRADVCVCVCVCVCAWGGGPRWETILPRCCRRS